MRGNRLLEGRHRLRIPAPFFAILCVAVAIASSVASVRAEGVDDLPKVVREQIDKAEAACRRTRGKPTYDVRQRVRAVDISADGIDDYLVDYSHLDCVDAGRKFLCSLKGCRLQVFLSTGQGRWVLAYDDRVRNFSVKSGSRGAVVHFNEVDEGGSASERQRKLVGSGSEVRFLD